MNTPINHPKLMKGIGVLLLGLGALIAVLFLFIQLPPVQRALLGLAANNALASSGFEARVTGAEGVWPWHIRAVRVELADAEGVFLQLDDIGVRLHPFALLGGSVAVERFEIGGGTYLRQPRALEQEHEPFRLPTIPSMIEVQRSVVVHTFVLGPLTIALTGDPILVQGSGGFQLDRRGLDAVLQLEAGDAGSAALTVQIDARAHELSVDATVSDPEGRWLTPFTPLAAGTPLTAALRASGPEGDIVLSSNAQWGQARFQLSGTADWQDSVAVSLSGALRDVLTGRARELAGPDQTFETSFVVVADGSIRIDSIHAYSDMLDGSLSGTVGNQVDLSGDLVVRNTGALASAMGLDALGEASIRFQVTGPRTAPLIHMNGDFARVGIGGATARDVGVNLQANVMRDGSIADGTFRAEIAALGGESLPSAFADQRATLLADFRADFTREEILVRTMNGAWGPITLEAEGDIAATGPMRFEGTIGVDDLARLDARLAGEGQLVAAVRRTRRKGPLEIELTGETQGFTATDELAQLIGPTPQFSVKASVTDEAVHLAGAEAALAAGSLNLTGEIDRLNNTVALEGRFDSADLSAFRADVAGAVTGEFAATGPMAVPEITITARSPALRSRSIELRNLDARFADRGSNGHLSLRANGSAGPIVVDLPFTRTGENLSGDLSFSAAGLEITGPLGLQDGVPRGALHAASEDIAALVTLLRAYGGTEDDVRAHGALAGDLSFEGLQGTASLTILNPAVEGIDAPMLASSIVLNAVLDVSEVPSIDGRLIADGVRFGPSRFSIIDAKARGPLAELNASLSLRGPTDDPFHLNVDAIRREAGTGSEITLTAADGQSLDFEVELTDGGTLTVGQQGLELRPTSFAVRNLATGREGVLSAEARLWAGAPYAQVTAEDVPAGSLAIFGLPVDWTGILDGTVTLDARGGASPLRVALIASELTNDPDLAPLDVRLTVDASGEELEAELALNDTANRTLLLSAQSTMPLIWRTGRFTPAVNWDAPLNGLVRAHAPLERLWFFVPVDSLGVSGTLDADVTIAGTLGSPQAHGAIHMAQGGFEHFRSGFLLRDGEGTLSFDQAGELTADIRATDGNGGRVRLTATAHLPRAQDWMVDGTLRLNQLTVARRDELHAQASGDLRLAGTLATARLEGTVTMDRIEAQIPNHLPPSVVDLRVVLVNGDGMVAENGNGNGSARGINLPVDLDVIVNVPRRAFVRGRGLDSEWGGSLALDGTLSQPRIDGMLSVVRGTFDLSRSRFTLTEGEIEFLGGDRIDPQVRIEGQAPGPEFTSIIRARGPARRPTITITSDPVMPQETVMAQMLFGKKPEELSAFELLQIGEATASVSGSGGFDILGTARRATGLDVLSIGSREASTGEQGVDVTVGRYVAPNVFVGARRGFEPGSGAVTVEMEVTPQITVDAEVRQDSEGSVGIDWRWDY